MFKLTKDPIDINLYVTQLRDPSCGAFTSFEGWVRNHHEGQSVSALEYEALAPLCQSEAEKIISEAISQFDVKKAFCIHRTGQLSVGDLSVWVGVSALHRDAAFKACRYIIDEIKRRLPIWKKEILSDGSAYWVNCEHSGAKQ